MSEAEQYPVEEVYEMLVTARWHDDMGGLPVPMPLTSATLGVFEATDTLGQFILRVDPDGNEARRTTRFVVRIERMD